MSYIKNVKAGFHDSMKRIMVVTPKGTFIKKHQCQDRLSVRYPPRVGPMIAEIPKAPVTRPMYFPRTAGGNISAMMT